MAPTQRLSSSGSEAAHRCAAPETGAAPSKRPGSAFPACEAVLLPPPTQTVVLLVGAHGLCAAVAFAFLAGKALALAVVFLALSALETAWRWREQRATRYLLEGDRVQAVRDPTGAPFSNRATASAERIGRLVALQRVGLWWRLTARTVKGTHFTIWTERWRLSAADDWRLAVRAQGWIGYASPPFA
ncbi:hypothetical protein [Hydrogenophilus thiooxidans]|uniref:hypothetical protein n=1 Tax=Hydrogenophilus thiooxidans TaxID=2820326 RepID=UPI001C23BF7C|nr:hypothetical protein [Hydrogenophilus thiooxidans]